MLRSVVLVASLVAIAQSAVDGRVRTQTLKVTASKLRQLNATVPEATAEPTAVPTALPTVEPTAVPTAEPTAAPTDPTAEPTAAPTAPTAEPTAAPTDPTAEPTAEPTFSPTFSPTESPTPRYPGYELVGSFLVEAGPSYTSNPQTFSCVEACAFIFGGTPGDFYASTQQFDITRTCYYDLSDGHPTGAIQTRNDTYKNCDYYDGATCESAYVNDHFYDQNDLNFCFSKTISRAPTDAPTHTPTLEPTSASPTYEPTARPTIGVNLSVPLLGSFWMADGPSFKTAPPTLSCRDACAQIFGNTTGLNASGFVCSVSDCAITNTAFANQYSGPVRTVTSSDRVCDNYTHSGCISAYVGDHAFATSAINYCYRNSADIPWVSTQHGPYVTHVIYGGTATYPLRGTFSVNHGPSWSTKPATLTCQETCAMLFGGLPEHYFGSVTACGVTSTCWYDEFAGSHSMKEHPHNAKNGLAYDEVGAFTAYVADHNQGYNVNYCFLNPSLAATAAPSESPVAAPSESPTESPIAV